MLKKESINKELSNIFGVLSYCIIGYNNLGYLDINHDLEDVIKDILNIICYGNFINCNDYEKNNKGIDLIDINSNIGIQVTSDQSITKIKDTLKKSGNVKVKFVYLSVNKVKHRMSGLDILNFIDLIEIAKRNNKLIELYNYIKNDTFVDEFIKKYFYLTNNIIDNNVSLSEIIKPFKNLDNYIVNSIYNSEKKYDIDDICIDMVEIINWIIGNRVFPTDYVIDFYKKYDSSNLKIDNDILKSRRRALISYFNNDLDSARNIYNYNFKKVIDSNITSWYVNDFLIDGRNILNRVDYSYFYSNKNKYQKEIRDKKITITYPFIDRIEKDILNMVLDKNIKYKYKNRTTKVFSVDLEVVFNNIQSLIYIAIIYGSITQLNLIRDLIRKVLFVYADSHNDKYLYIFYLKLCIFSSSFKEYKNICDRIILNYSEFEDYDYIKKVLGYRKNINDVYKNDFDIFVFDYYGRLLNDNDFLKFENRVLKLLESNTKINDICKSLPSNLARINNKSRLFNILNSLVTNNYKRQVEEVIRYVKYKDLSDNDRIIVKDIISKLDINENSLITNLLLDIKIIDNTSIYDKYITRTDDDKLFCKLMLSDDYSVSNLDLIVDRLIFRHSKCIKDNCVISYAIDFYIPSNYFENDSIELRKIIEDKLLPLCLNSLSSEKIEYEEKIKLLKCLIYIHYFDKRYDSYIKNIYDNLKLESEESFLEKYDIENLKIYVLAIKYILEEITLLDLINECMIVMNNDYLFIDIKNVLDYVLLKENNNDEIINILFVIISIMLKSDKVENRVEAIKLSRRLYKSYKFDKIYNELYKISINSSFKEVKALISVIKDLDLNDEMIKKLVDNIKNNKNYNIRYISLKYLDL